MKISLFHILIVFDPILMIMANCESKSRM